MTTAANPRAVAGDNQPPSPFDEVRTKIESLYAEAKMWLDGEPVTTKGQADSINKLIVMITDAAKEADALRVKENEPFDTGKAEVQARYAPLIADTKSVKGKTVLAVAAAKKALTPWLTKLDDEKRAAEAKARAEAEEAARKAQEAFRQSDVADLAAREEAEWLALDAKKKDIAARVAANDKAQAKGGTGRATGLRSFYTPEITDYVAFARWVWINRKEEMRGFLHEMAAKLVHQNPAVKADGLQVNEERRAV
jgi:hypothetical protein